MVRILTLSRALCGYGAAQRTGAEIDDLRAERGCRGGADDVPSRGNRRRPELGLPLLLDPRRHLRSLCTFCSGLQRRGGPVLGFPLAALPARRIDASDHVRHRRGAVPARTVPPAPW